MDGGGGGGGGGVALKFEMAATVRGCHLYAGGCPRIKPTTVSGVFRFRPNWITQTASIERFNCWQ